MLNKQDIKNEELYEDAAENEVSPAAESNSFTIEQLEAELRYETDKKSFWKSLRRSLHILITIIALAALAATQLIPIYKVKGGSMSPALAEGDIVVTIKGGKYETGDIVAFYNNNQILIKRVLAGPGDTIDITEDGKVTVNGEVIDEPYVTEAATDNGDIPLPCNVPEREWFVLCDNRSNIMDSRSLSIGTINEERIVGKVVFRLFPMQKIGTISQNT